MQWLYTIITLLLLSTGDCVAPRQISPDTDDLNDHSQRYTPGFFRQAYLLSMQEPSSLEIVDFLEAAQLGNNLLPAMFAGEEASLRALMDQCRALVATAQQYSQETEDLARAGLEMCLGFDPALDFSNPSATQADQLPLTPGGAATLAQYALWSMQALTLESSCLEPPQTLAYFEPGEAEVVWIDEICLPDEWVGAYCLPDEWESGPCDSQWVPEYCHGGYWQDQGYYEYLCYSDNDCQYLWREVWVWIPETCSGGYYLDNCEDGSWIPGYCYEGTFVPGYCIPGHYEWRFPGASWTFQMPTATPSICQVWRPLQQDIAETSLEIIAQQLYDQLEPYWQAGIDSLMQVDLNDDIEGSYDAHLQLLRSISQSGPPAQSLQ